MIPILLVIAIVTTMGAMQTLSMIGLMTHAEAASCGHGDHESGNGGSNEGPHRHHKPNH